MINLLSPSMNPVPTNTAIADTLAVLNAISDAPSQAKFLAVVVARAKDEAAGVADRGRAELATKQAAIDAKFAAVTRAQTEIDTNVASANALNTTYAQQHAAAMGHATDELTKALDLAKDALASKAKYEGLLADLRARVG